MYVGMKYCERFQKLIHHKAVRFVAHMVTVDAGNLAPLKCGFKPSPKP